MTLEQILGGLYRKLGYASSPSAEVTERLTGFVNEIYQRVLGMPGMGSLTHDALEQNMVGTPCALPFMVGRVMGIRDKDNDITLRGVSWEWYRDNVPDPDGTTGIPRVWAPDGYSCCLEQPADASKVYITSTSASDVQTCQVEGIIVPFREFSESVTLTGVTPVQVGSSAYIVRLTKISLSSPAVGTIDITEDSDSGTSLASIQPGQITTRYPKIALYPQSSTNILYAIDYERTFSDMVLPHEEPVLPRQFHWVLEAGARMLEYEKIDDRRYPAALADFQRGVRDLKWFVSQQADGSDTHAGHSSLGAWYPAGS
jgi:hypothetical protein